MIIILKNDNFVPIKIRQYLLHALSLTLVFILSSCRYAMDEIQDTIEEIPVITANTPTEKAYSTLTVSPSPSPSAFPTDTPEDENQVSCPEVKIQTEIPENFLAEGKIILYELSGVIMDDKLYTITDSERTPVQFLEGLQNGYFSEFRTSIDRRYVSFLYSTETSNGIPMNSMIVTDSSLGEYQDIPWDEENWAYGIREWLGDGERIVITPRTLYVDDVILFNVFTRKQELLDLEYSSPAMNSRMDHWLTLASIVAYDPMLTRVLIMEEDDTMILLDLEEHQELARVTEPDFLEYVVPLWSPDGEYLVYADYFREVVIDQEDPQMGMQAVLMNREGAEVWRGDIHPAFYDIHSIGDFTWSPDSNYFTYRWMNNSAGEIHTYMVEAETLEITEYCFYGLAPVWSPDSRQFIMKMWDNERLANEQEEFGIIIVDIESGEIIQIDDISYWPVSWLTDVQ